MCQYVSMKANLVFLRTKQLMVEEVFHSEPVVRCIGKTSEVKTPSPMLALRPRMMRPGGGPGSQFVPASWWDQTFYWDLIRACSQLFGASFLDIIAHRLACLNAYPASRIWASHPLRSPRSEIVGKASREQIKHKDRKQATASLHTSKEKSV